MTQLRCLTSASLPQFDGTRVLFEITIGTDRVPCAISRLALEELSGERLFKPAQYLSRFAKSRHRIETLALQKLRARRHSVPCRLNLWADDVDDPPTGSMPAAAAMSLPAPCASA